jgi:uncharacterized protein (DUF58 family)
MPRWLHGAATRDLVPGITPAIRRVALSPLGLLMATALAAFLCGVFLQPQGFILFGSVLAVIVLGLAWPWITVCGLRGSISFEKTRSTEGESAEACLTLTNLLPWSAYGLTVRVDQGDTDEDDGHRVSIACVPGQRTLKCRWTFTPARRGVYPLTPPVLASGFPFGLHHRQRRLTVDAELIVWPRTYETGPVPSVAGDQHVEGAVSRQRVGSSGDVLGVRPYRRGDSPRLIHWQQSARHDRLIVCELQANSRPTIQIVLDADPAVHAGAGPDSSREWAIRMAASLAQGWLDEGAEVGAVWNAQEVPAASGSRHLNTLLDALARLPDHGTPFKRTLDLPGRRAFRCGLQVIITTDQGAAVAGLRRPEQNQRWLILRCAGFGEVAESRPSSVPGQRAIVVDAPQEIPAVLQRELS